MRAAQPRTSSQWVILRLLRKGEEETELALDDRIDTLKDEKAKLKAEAAAAETEAKKPAPAAAAGDDSTDPVVLAWVEDGNEWFRDDKRMNAYAVQVGEDLRRDGSKLMGRAFLDAVRTQMEEDFPSKFKKGNPLRQRAGAMEAGGNGGNGGEPAGRTEADLPKQDRDLMRKFVAGPGLQCQQHLPTGFEEFRFRRCLAQQQQG